MISLLEEWEMTKCLEEMVLITCTVTRKLQTLMIKTKTIMTQMTIWYYLETTKCMEEQEMTSCLGLSAMTS